MQSLEPPRRATDTPDGPGGGGRPPGAILVAYATKTGGTADIAQAVGNELERVGLTVDVRPVEEVSDVRRYDAVLLGSAIYLGKWRPEALRFGEGHAQALRARMVWLFDSGPLFSWPDQGKNEAVPAADDLMRSIGARSRTTFGGKLEEKDAGFLTRRIMASGKAGSYGDFRNFERIRKWAHQVGLEVQAARATVAR